MISFQELLDERGAVDARWLPLAAHEADCAGQPYIGPEHVDLARARHNGDQERYHEPAGALYPLGRHRWWRPLGCRSALRKAGILATVAALRAALGSAIADEHRSQRS